MAEYLPLYLGTRLTYSPYFDYWVRILSWIEINVPPSLDFSVIYGVPG